MLWRFFSFMYSYDTELLPLVRNGLLGGWLLDQPGEHAVERLVLHMLEPDEGPRCHLLPFRAEGAELR